MHFPLIRHTKTSHIRHYAEGHVSETFRIQSALSKDPNINHVQYCISSYLLTVTYEHKNLLTALTGQ